MRRLFCHAAAWVLLLLPCGAAPAQNGSADSSQTYTLRADTRSVITDVLVLDHAGTPVHGLPDSAFHLSDENQMQSLTSFEEHAEVRQATRPEDSLAPGVFSNVRLMHMPPVLNILVIDISNLTLPDQMYLANQLERCIDNLPAGVPLAVYLNAGLQSVLLQDFTANHQQLLEAVHHAVPHFAALGRDRFTDVATLRGIAADFSGIPGRKNVLWFSGGSALTLNPTGLIATPSAELRLVYDELEAARIAVYPIDARGLLTASALPGFRSNAAAVPYDSVATGDVASAQHGLMQDVATATGGLPFYNNNGVWQGAIHDLQTGSNFYTLSYTPKNLKFDNRWHRVRVTVDGPYALSYRRGYFADGANTAVPAGSRTRLLAGSRTQQVEQRKPIIFRAEVKPIAPDKLPAGERPPATGQTRYSIQYLIPGSTLTLKQQGAETEAVVGVGFLALDRNGRPLLQHAKQITYAVHREELKQHPDAMLPVSQELDLNRGDTYLTLMVWDEIGRTVGTLNVPLQVPKAR